MEEVRLLGVVTATDEGPRVAYLKEDVKVTDELLSQAAPAQPTEVFRFAAQCEEKRCAHFNGQQCKLIQRMVQILPAVVDHLPICLIRSTCRWFKEGGRDACIRCPQVVTESTNASSEFERAALPQD
jgi:hypothetical protein